MSQNIRLIIEANSKSCHLPKNASELVRVPTIETLQAFIVSDF